jgi:hypothetical protein
VTFKPLQTRSQPSEITYDQYLKLTSWLRDFGGDGQTLPDFGAASHATSIPEEICKIAYSKGYPKRVPPLKPIKELLRSEREEARAIRHNVTKDLVAREASKQVSAFEDAAQTRAQEALLVKASRSIAGKLLSQTLNLVSATESLTASVVAQIKEEMEGQNLMGQPKSTLDEKFAVLRNISSLAQNSTQLAQKAMELERKFVGVPEQNNAGGKLGIEDAIAALIEGAADLRMLQKRRAEDGAIDAEIIDAEELLLKEAIQTLSKEEIEQEIKRAKSQ